MKKLTSYLLCLIITVTAQAQSFEGQVTYSTTTIGMSEEYKPFFPTSLDIFSLGSDVMLRVNGGMMTAMMGDLITKGSENKTYLVLHARKITFTMDPALFQTNKKPEITLQGEEIINGYACKKYLVKLNDQNGQDNYQFMWMTTDLPFRLPAITPFQTYHFNIEGIEGVPVKIDMHFNFQGTAMRQELTLSKVSDTKPPADLFTIPADYKKEVFTEKGFTGQ